MCSREQGNAMQGMQIKGKKGFTLMELLIVIAIIGILIAIAVPLFTGKLREAKVATNKANIRSAKAVAAAQYYTDEAAGKFPKDNSHAYYYFDTKSGTINLSKSTYPSNYANNDATTAYNTAAKYEVCSFIIVYVAPNKGEKGANIQTSPYYTDESGSLPAVTKGGGGKPNYFGPDPG